MGRKPRVITDGFVYHPLNHGNNRARVFHHDAGNRPPSQSVTPSSPRA